MPIYEYQCKSCGHKFEAIQRINDGSLKNCPGCNKPELKKLISAVGFRLKGGGWYETDFKSGDKKKNLVGDKSGSETSTSKDSSATTTEKSTNTEKSTKTEKTAS
ncbi:MAG: FmdB family zinc ribbon protein [Methylococcales bacterium]